MWPQTPSDDQGLHQASLRTALFRHLDKLLSASPGETLRSEAINTFRFHGQLIRPIVQTGIRKPKSMDAALTIRTTFTPIGKEPPYQDSTDGPGLILYKHRGLDPLHPDNQALRTAMEKRVPLAYFVGIASGRYLPVYPVYVVGEDSHKHEFLVEIAADGEITNWESRTLDQSRRYSEAVVKVRLHQPVFRARVMDAYSSTCAMCHLRHPELLDAAHILPDTHLRGQPVVPNGIALCKLHHAAFDRNFIGVRPDYSIVVRQSLIDETDGPTLLHGIQEMQDKRLVLPKAKAARPDPERLEERFQEFCEASGA